MPFPNIGPGELILLLIIALVVLGPGKLPDVAASLGKSVREFRRAATDVTEAGKLDAPPAAPASTGSSVAAPTAPTSASNAGPAELAPAEPVPPGPVAPEPAPPEPVPPEPAVRSSDTAEPPSVEGEARTPVGSSRDSNRT